MRWKLFLRFQLRWKKSQENRKGKGAWVTEIGNQDTREYGEYHLDVRYNTDSGDLVDMKERKAIYDKAMEPINANDVIVKFTKYVNRIRKTLAVEFDGTLCAVKAACTVWSGGKSGDNFKGLPIAIRCKVPGNEAADVRRRCCPYRYYSCTSAFWFVLNWICFLGAGRFPVPKERK